MSLTLMRSDMWVSPRKIMVGADRGARPSQRALAMASVSSREPAYEQLNGSTAVTGTCWLSMVRRRSTVRFRKGALRSEVFFGAEPVTCLAGFPGAGTDQRPARRRGWHEAQGPGRSVTAARAGGECLGGTLGARSLSRLVRGVRAGPWPAAPLTGEWGCGRWMMSLRVAGRG
jgi:hypothetical protein